MSTWTTPRRRWRLTWLGIAFMLAMPTMAVVRQTPEWALIFAVNGVALTWMLRSLDRRLFE